MPEMKLVRALRNGFHIGRRRTGEEFQVPKEMTYSWFEEVLPPAPPPSPPKKSKTLSLPHKGTDGDDSALIE